MAKPELYDGYKYKRAYDGTKLIVDEHFEREGLIATVNREQAIRRHVARTYQGVREADGEAKAVIRDYYIGNSKSDYTVIQGALPNPGGWRENEFVIDRLESPTKIPTIIFSAV